MQVTNQLPAMQSLKILPILLLLFIFKAQGQENIDFLNEKMFTLNDNYLPDGLLKTKSIVLIKMPETGVDHKRGNWKKLAREIHGYIVARGIDPVWYFYINDIYAGPDLTKSIANSLITREIENVVIFNKINERSYDLYITTFNKNEYFFKQGQNSVKIHAVSTAQINRDLAILIDRKDLIRENLMVLETPEYYNQTSLIRGKRFQQYAVDLKLDKLAIPELKSLGNILIPVNLSISTREEGKLNNTDSMQVSPDLQTILKQYPYEYAILKYNFDEQAIRKKGYPFVLLWLHNTAPVIQNILKYPTVNDGDIKTGDQNQEEDGELLVYKFYIKHIYTGDVYLGTTWDADTNWHKALQNHIEQFNKSIKP